MVPRSAVMGFTRTTSSAAASGVRTAQHRTRESDVVRSWQSPRGVVSTSRIEVPTLVERVAAVVHLEVIGNVAQTVAVAVAR